MNLDKAVLVVDGGRLMAVLGVFKLLTNVCGRPTALMTVKRTDRACLGFSGVERAQSIESTSKSSGQVIPMSE